MQKFWRPGQIAWLVARLTESKYPSSAHFNAQLLFAKLIGGEEVQHLWHILYICLHFFSCIKLCKQIEIVPHKLS